MMMIFDFILDCFLFITRTTLISIFIIITIVIMLAILITGISQHCWNTWRVINREYRDKPPRLEREQKTTSMNSTKDFMDEDSLETSKSL